MKVQHYNALVRAMMSRRAMLKGAAGMGAAAAMGGGLGGAARAQSDLRAEILQIPGVGMGSPTDADWRRVGELCLGATRERFEAGAFEGSS